MRVFLIRGEFAFIKGQEDLANITGKNQVFYDEIYNKIIDAKIVSYIKRDKAIIENSDIIFCYYKEDKVINKQKIETNSGTALAIKYAVKLDKIIINIINKDSGYKFTNKKLIIRKNRNEGKY